MMGVVYTDGHCTGRFEGEWARKIEGEQRGLTSPDDDVSSRPVTVGK
jgi:hypothetical protein